MKKKSHKGTALDLIQTVYMESHLPLIYCYMVLDAEIDAERLKQAVRSTAKIIPQILCRYNGAKNTWSPAKYDPDLIVQIVSGKKFHQNLIWDLQTGPQLKMNILRQPTGDRLQIAMSHILTDGAGFQQYLALLCKFYHEQNSLIISKKNIRSVVPLLFHPRIQRLPRISKGVNKGNLPIILPVDQGPKQLYPLKVTLSEKQLEMVRERAKNLHVTLNDVFLASYAYTLKSFTMQDEMILPCPADLRKFGIKNDNLTIANMTGKYLCPVSFEKNAELEEIILAVHREMERQKSRKSWFYLLLLLQILHVILPANLFRMIAKSFYAIESTSYTNMGTIEEKSKPVISVAHTGRPPLFRCRLVPTTTFVRWLQICTVRKSRGLSECNC